MVRTRGASENDRIRLKVRSYVLDENVIDAAALVQLQATFDIQWVALNDQQRRTLRDLIDDNADLADDAIALQMAVANGLRRTNDVLRNGPNNDEKYNALVAELQRRVELGDSYQTAADRAAAVIGLMRDYGFHNAIRDAAVRMREARLVDSAENLRRAKVLGREMKDMPGRNDDKRPWDRNEDPQFLQEDHRRRIQERHRDLYRQKDAENRAELQAGTIVPLDQAGAAPPAAPHDPPGNAADLLEPTIGPRWVFLANVNEMTMSCTVGVWAKVDNRNRIIERVVRKETYVGVNGWTDPATWADGQSMLQAVKVPWEWRCHEAVAGLHDARFVVQPIAYRTDFETFSYRLYTAHCPHGNLGDVVGAHAKYEDAAVPEPVLWYLLECFVETGLLMERGYLGQGATPEEWLQIVHRDLKPSNIFLDLPDGTRDIYPRWPTPKVGDFGLAFQTSEESQMNPLAWNTGAGTRFFRPPEQRRFVDRTTGEFVDAFKLLAHTNVWGFAMVLCSLMHQGKSYFDLPYRGDRIAEPQSFVPQFRPDVFDNYSSNLVRIISRCLEFDPADRPSFQTLMGMINSFANDTDEDDDSDREDDADEDEDGEAVRDPERGRHLRDVRSYVLAARSGQQPNNQKYTMLYLADPFPSRIRWPANNQ